MNGNNERRRSNSDIGPPRSPPPQPTSAQPAAVDPMANRIGNTFGRVNMLAQHRRESGVLDPSGFINSANQAVRALPAIPCRRAGWPVAGAAVSHPQAISLLPVRLGGLSHYGLWRRQVSFDA